MGLDILKYSRQLEKHKYSANILTGLMGQSGNYMPDSLTLTEGKVIEWLI